MFLKINTRKKNNKTYYYAEIVEGYRENGKVKHRRISYIGAVSLDTANRLKKAFSKDESNFVNVDELKFKSSCQYGDFQYLHSLFKILGIFKHFSKSFEAVDSHISVTTALEYIKIMIIHRIIEPGSKLALMEWLEHTPYKHFFDVDFELQSMYRSLEVLEKNLSNVEDYLYRSSLNLFNQNRNELFYDITSSYVEGHKCIIAEYGYTRDHRRDKKQIIIGLVTTYDGFPIKCNIYKGNTADKTTVASVVKELKNQFDIAEFVFVGDRGMLTSSNIEEIKEAKQKFVMAIPRDWTKKYLKDVVISSDRMDEIIKGELYSKYIDYKKSKEDKNKGYAETDQLLLCLNTQKREDDKLYREKVMNNLKEEFIELNKKANNPKSKIVKKEDLISKAAIIKKKKYGKYFNINYIAEAENKCNFKVEYTVDEDKLNNDKKLDGTFLIQTNTSKYGAEELIHIYKNLNEVEMAFKVIKNELDIRPIFHRNTERVKGHVYICVLAYYIHNAIRYRLKENNIKLSTPKLLNMLRKVALVEMEISSEKTIYSLTEISKNDKEIFDQMGIKMVAPKK